jgi:hypothetical protein
MDDVAKLGISVDSSSVKTGAENLNVIAESISEARAGAVGHEDVCAACEYGWAK